MRIRTLAVVLLSLGALAVQDAAAADANAAAAAVDKVVVRPAKFQARWIGQRKALRANAFDADGKRLPLARIEWASSAPQVAAVDPDGLVTAKAAGAATITASATNGVADSTAVIVTSEVPTDTGDWYTAWFARSDDTPVTLIDGKLAVYDDIYCLNRDEGTWHVCPSPIAAPFYNPPAATSPWRHPGVAKFQWAGDRIGILHDLANGRGTFRVVDRADEWTVLVLGNASDFHLEGDRIGALVGDGKLIVKDGIHGPWTTLLSSGVQRFALEGDRIASLSSAGELRAKDGINGSWAILASSGARDFGLEGQRIALLEDDGSLRVKDGLNSAWSVLATGGIRTFALAGDRIAVLRDDGVVLVKDGINGAWVQLASGGVSAIALNGDRIALLRDDSSLLVKDGVDGTWVTLVSTGALAVQLQQGYIGVVIAGADEQGPTQRLQIKEELFGPWRQVTEVHSEIVQFRVVVDDPVPPHRTSPEAYDRGQQKCLAANASGTSCLVTAYVALPEPYYGLFCGTDRPSDADRDAAEEIRPIDTLDAICRHRGYHAQWYPEATTAPYECIGSYALAHARVTRNGVALAPGSGAWASVMSKMPNMLAAIGLYEGFTVPCHGQKLQDFTAATAARH